MTIAIQRFCVNRKIAPALSIEAFFRLVNSLGLNKVELRNDMAGGRVTDDLSAAEVRELAEHYHIEIVTINAVYPFNQCNERVHKLTESLLAEAKSIGSGSLVLCPLNDGSIVSPEETLNALRDLAPLFARYDVKGLIEPLGFPQSSLRSAAHTQNLIRDAQVPFKLLIDTFHHHLYSEAEAEFSQIDITQIGLVHLSGVENNSPRETLTDDERIMLTPKDRLITCQQVKRLEQRGYKGVYSFEPFASLMVDWSEADIRRNIENSIELIQKN